MKCPTCGHHCFHTPALVTALRVLRRRIKQGWTTKGAAVALLQADQKVGRILEGDRSKF